MAVNVVVVGDVAARLTVHAERLPRPHQMVDGYGFTQSLTGRGALRAVAAAKFGAAVTFIAAIGEDVNGDYVQQALADVGVQTQFITRSASHPTGTQLYIAENEAKGMGCAVVGANAYLSEQHVKAAEAAIAGADMVVAGLGVPAGAVARAFQLAKKHDVRSLLKPTPIVRTVADELLMLPDFITPNEEELRRLANQADRQEILPHQTTICTLGAKGIHWFRKPSDTLETGQAAGFQVRAVDTEGAGDVFSAALAVALVEGQTLPDAIQFANAAGALTTTRRGTIEAIPSRGAVEQLLAAKPEKTAARE